MRHVIAVILALLCSSPAAAQPTATPRDQAWLARFQLPPPTPCDGRLYLWPDWPQEAPAEPVTDASPVACPTGDAEDRCLAFTLSAEPGAVYGVTVRRVEGETESEDSNQIEIVQPPTPVPTPTATRTATVTPSRTATPTRTRTPVPTRTPKKHRR